MSRTWDADAIANHIKTRPTMEDVLDATKAAERAGFKTIFTKDNGVKVVIADGVWLGNSFFDKRRLAKEPNLRKILASVL